MDSTIHDRQHCGERPGTALKLSIWGGAAALKSAVESHFGAPASEVPREIFPITKVWETSLDAQSKHILSGCDVIVLDLADGSLGDWPDVLDAAFFSLRPRGRVILAASYRQRDPVRAEIRRRLYLAGFHQLDWQYRLPGLPPCARILAAADKPLQFHEAPASLPLPAPRRTAQVMHLAGANWHCNWVVEQLRELARLGHDVTAVISGTGPLSEKLEQAGIRYRCMYLDFAWGLETMLSFLAGLCRLVRYLYGVKPDVVHYHIFHSSVIGRLAAWLADAPVRVTMSPSPYYMAAPASRDIEKMTAWMDTAILATSSRIYDLYAQAGIDGGRLHLIRYGDDPKKYDPDSIDRQAVRGALAGEFGFPPGSPLVVRVSYFYPPLPDNPFTPSDIVHRTIKDHETLIAAAPAILESFPDTRFLLPGGAVGAAGERYLESLKETVRSLGLADRVIFPGYRADAHHILAAADVAISCSFNHENDGGAKEALLMERPLVATRCGGIPDYVRHEQTGLLIEPGNSSDLARSVVRLLADREQAAAMGRQGRAYILRQFTLDTTVDQLDALYTSQLAASRGAAYRKAVTVCRVLVLPFIIIAFGWRFYSLQFVTSYLLDWGNRAKWIWLNAIHRLRLMLPGLAKRLQDLAIGLPLALLFLAVVGLAVLSGRQAGWRSRNAVITGRNGAARTLFASDLPAYSAGAATGDCPPLCPPLWWIAALWNVVRGDISLVGPRLRRHVEGNSLPDALRHLKPGLTGWSQANWNPGVTEQELDAMDDLYAATWTTWLDMKLLLKSLLSALKLA